MAPHDEENRSGGDDTVEYLLADDPDPTLDALGDVRFPVVRRGYDRGAVDAYVTRVSLRLAELESASSPQDAIQRALDEVGQETAGILRQAQETARQMTTRAEAQARERLQHAVREAGRLLTDAEADVRRLDKDTDRIWAERQRLIDDVRRLAESLLGMADDALDRFPPDATTEGPHVAGEQGADAERGADREDDENDDLDRHSPRSIAGEDEDDLPSGGAGVAETEDEGEGERRSGSRSSDRA